MTELERLLIGRLEQMEKQTAALELQLQRQELSLSECQRVCVEALESCGTLCGELQSEFETLRRGVRDTNSTTEKALGLLSTAVGTLKPALDGLLKVRS
jgi:hypothetical protein